MSPLMIERGIDRKYLFVPENRCSTPFGLLRLIYIRVICYSNGTHFSGEEITLQEEYLRRTNLV